MLLSFKGCILYEWQSQRNEGSVWFKSWNILKVLGNRWLNKRFNLFQVSSSKLYLTVVVYCARELDLLNGSVFSQRSLVVFGRVSNYKMLLGLKQGRGPFYPTQNHCSSKNKYLWQAYDEDLGILHLYTGVISSSTFWILFEIRHIWQIIQYKTV